VKQPRIYLTTEVTKQRASLIVFQRQAARGEKIYNCCFPSLSSGFEGRQDTQPLAYFAKLLFAFRNSLKISHELLAET